MDTGGKIRTGNILKHLSKKHHITLVSNTELPKDKPFLSHTDSLCDRFLPIYWKEVQRHSLQFYLRLIIQLFSFYPVNVLNDTSPELRLAVEKELQQGGYDLAICDFVQSALMFRHAHNLPTILFQHNVEAVIIGRHVTRAANPISRFFWWLQWKKMLQFEKQACRRFTSVIAVSEKDRAWFKKLYGLNNVHTIPTGVDSDYFRPIPDVVEKANSMVFCGSMDWLPNEDAMYFFLDDIFPLIKRAVPEATLTIVGRNPPTSLKRRVKSFKNVNLTGWVEDTRPYIAQSAVAIVPIRIGGGTRMKIFEAMAMGKAVVATSIGAEGLPVAKDVYIAIEDDPNRFAEKIVELMNDRSQRVGIGKAAMTFVRQHYAWPIVVQAFDRICQATAMNNGKAV